MLAQPPIALLVLAAAFSFLPRSAAAQFSVAESSPPASRFGVAWGDFDNDGDLDLYVTQDGPNELLRNDGDRFRDVASGGLADPGNGSAAPWGDYDNDGDLDLYLVNYLAPNHLLRNDGAGAFSDVTQAPLNLSATGMGASWVDVNNDGRLDLYVVHYGVPNKLFLNQGAAGFVDATSGPLGDAGWGYAAAWADYDGDGDQDVYICNDGPNRLLRNDGGAFVNVATGTLMGSAVSEGAAWGDYDNDGDLDLYVSNYGTTNRLFRNDGTGFTDVTAPPLGDLGNGTGVAWGDYDNDGDLDLYLANDGTGNSLFRNDGSAFSDATAPPLDDDGNSTGVAWGDYDNDGDLDLYLANDGQASRLFRNDLASGSRWLQVSLVGTVSNRSGIGARVKAWAGGVPHLVAISGGSGYMSENSLVAQFGLGAATVLDSLVVRWPSGIVQRYTGVSSNQRLTVVEQPGVSVADADPGPPSLELGAPAPNPVREETRIRLAVPNACTLRLRLFDLQGRAVATLAEGPREAGFTTISWSGRNARGERLGAGVYLLRLEAGGEVRQRKIVLASR